MTFATWLRRKKPSDVTEKTPLSERMRSRAQNPQNTTAKRKTRKPRRRGGLERMSMRGREKFKNRKWLPILHTIRTERMKDIRALAMVFPNGFKASFDQAA